MKTSVIILASLICVAPLPCSRAMEQSMDQSASVRLGEDAFEHRFEAAVASNDDVFVAIKKRPVGASGPWRSSIWKINAVGKVVNTIDLNEPSQPATAESLDVAAMARLKDGSLACAVLSESHELSIAQVSGQNVIWSVKNKSISANLRVLRMIATSDGNLMILGQRATHATYIKLTLNAISIWEHEIPADLPGMVFDGMPTGQGGAFLVADFWSGNPFMVGESSIVVARVSADGAIQVKTRFRGRRPRMTLSPRSGPVLVYDKGDSASQDIVVEEFSEALEPVWTTSVLTNDHGLQIFKIGRLQGGDYAVVGGDDIKLFACTLDQAGKLLGSFKDPQIQSSDFNLYSTQQGFLTIYPIFSFVSLGSQRKLNTKLGVTIFDHIR